MDKIDEVIDDFGENYLIAPKIDKISL